MQDERQGLGKKKRSAISILTSGRDKLPEYTIEPEKPAFANKAQSRGNYIPKHHESSAHDSRGCSLDGEIGVLDKRRRNNQISETS